MSPLAYFAVAFFLLSFGALLYAQHVLSAALTEALEAHRTLLDGYHQIHAMLAVEPASTPTDATLAA